MRCAYRWLARYRSGSPASLADRRSVRRTLWRTQDPQLLQLAVDLRQQHLTLRHIAGCCGLHDVTSFIGPKVMRVGDAGDMSQLNHLLHVKTLIGPAQIKGVKQRS
jgi:hypothetical protein